VSVEVTSGRAWVGVSAAVAPQLANTALPHLTPASPRRRGRFVAVPKAYRDRQPRSIGSAGCWGLAAHDARGLWPAMAAGKVVLGVITGRWCWPDSVGNPPLPATVSSSTRSCSLGRWGTTRPQFYCSWPATGCAQSALFARRWTRCPDGSRLDALSDVPRTWARAAGQKW
jgi:hypothetical protein